MSWNDVRSARTFDTQSFTVLKIRVDSQEVLEILKSNQLKFYLSIYWIHCIHLLLSSDLVPW